MAQELTTTLAVLGGGPGGYTAAHTSIPFSISAATI